MRAEMDLQERHDRTTADGDAYHAAALLAGRSLLIVGFLYVLVLLLKQIGLVTVTLTVAVMLSAILEPIVGVLVRRGVPRWFAATMVFLLGIGSIVGALWFVVSEVTGNTGVLTTRLQEAAMQVSTWLQNGPAHMSSDQVEQLQGQFTSRLTVARGDVADGALATASSAFNIITGAILCLFTLLFLLLDDGQIWRWVVRLFPARERLRVETGGTAAWRTLVAYMRSTIVLAVINALSMVPVMMIAGLDLVVPLAVLLFLGSLIPMIGMVIAGAVLMLVALVLQGPLTAVAMVVALFLVVQVEGNLINPYILGKAVQIHPLVILATVTGGTIVGGAFGAFVAVPLVAVVNNVFVAVRAATPSPEDPTSTICTCHRTPRTPTTEPTPTTATSVDHPDDQREPCATAST
ncbi:putative transport protein [Austwickia sp. TVS 96-490-7B]|nr:putative transport protein [Austwickia sp. TVS 96-490-7B]